MSILCRVTFASDRLSPFRRGGEFRLGLPVNMVPECGTRTDHFFSTLLRENFSPSGAVPAKEAETGVLGWRLTPSGDRGSPGRRGSARLK